MKKASILGELDRKDTDAKDVAEKVLKNQDLLQELFDGISSASPRVRFGSMKALRILSEKDPEMLYSRMDFFVCLLDGENNILKWNAMDVVANLVLADSKNEFDKIFEKFFDLLSDESLITAGHVVDNSGKIARAKPHLTRRITSELLKVEKFHVKLGFTQECKNILLGKAILVFDAFFDQIEDKDKVVAFVKRQLNNTRNATRVKAKGFLRKRRQL